MVKIKIVPQKEKITNKWPVKRVAFEYTPISWEKVFESSRDEIEDVSDILEEDRCNGRRFPDNENLFKPFHYVPIYKVKVVIFGQDPLSDGRTQDTGFSYSIPKDCPLTPSLKNIYKELSNTFSGFVSPDHGDLTNWCFNGVLLLNSCLTVREMEPGSHKELWNGFIKKVVNSILDINPTCIFVLWGKNIQKLKKIIGERALILEASNPSFSYGFTGCNHFNIINEYLVKQKKTPIDWNV